MTISSSIKPSSYLSYPAGYNPLPRDVDDFGSSAKLFATQDYALLGHQSRLVDRVLDGSIGKDEFCRKAGMLEGFEEKRARLRGDGGLTRRERADLRNDMKRLAGKMQAILPDRIEASFPSAGSDLGPLYDALASGKVGAVEAVNQLHWRSDTQYGQKLALRSGPVYGDERHKLRAYLAEEAGFISPFKLEEPAAPKAFSFDAPQAYRLVERTTTFFSQLDSNDNGLIDADEAQYFLANYKDFGVSASEAATLYSCQEEISSLSDQGPASAGKIALSDLEATLLLKDGGEPALHMEPVMRLIEERILDQDRRSYSEVEPPLYASSEGPDGKRVAQGLEGSCWFLSALPAVDNKTLKHALVAEAGGYRMRFADGTSEKVSPLNEAERRVYSRGDGGWSGLMEKAVAQKLLKQGDGLRGGYPQEALRLLTGQNCSVHFLDLKSSQGPDYRDPKALGQLLENTLAKRGAVFAQANSGDFDPSLSLISQSRHAYTVIAYDPENEVVSLRNPWGRGERADRDGVDDGNFQLSLTQMLANFSLVVTEDV